MNANPINRTIQPKLWASQQGHQVTPISNVSVRPLAVAYSLQVQVGIQQAARRLPSSAALTPLGVSLPKSFSSVMRDSTLGCRPFQKRGVAGIVVEFSCVEDVVSLVPQPFCQSAAGAAVDQKLHRVSTEIAASVSPAITAWAYAMQALSSVPVQASPYTQDA